jgi:FHS family L-fucose permease-like MFS transporter
MAFIIGVILPALTGFVSDASNIRYAFLLPILCFAYIGWYSSTGH